MNTFRQSIGQVYSGKELVRSGWKRVGVTSPETVSSHSHGMLVLAVMHSDALVKEYQGLILQRLYELCIVHDLAETDPEVGDITPHDGISKQQKFTLEKKAISKISGRLETHRMLELWEEFESETTTEAIVAKQLDVLDMLTQASLYAEQQGVNTQEFFESSRQKITSTVLNNFLNRFLEQ